MAHVSRSRFPGCCGVSVLRDAYKGYSEPDHSILKALIEKRIRATHRQGLVVYTTTPNQVDVIACLEELGFQKLTVFHNPNTGNMVTVHGLQINQPHAQT